MARSRNRRPVSSRSWDEVANWYAGWVGKHGSNYHRQVVIPAVLDLLAPREGERILDIGCGPGVLAPHIASAGALYTGIDKSRRLIDVARRHHGRSGRFLIGDATRLTAIPEVACAVHDAATFVLSIQDIAPLDGALRSTAQALKRTARIVIVMTHPCFRVPRQSGWGYDAGRRLQFRRIDRYLSALEVPMKEHAGGRGTTVSYHRPLSAYVDGLRGEGFAIDELREIAVEDVGAGPPGKAERAAFREIPMFLAMRTVRR